MDPTPSSPKGDIIPLRSFNILFESSPSISTKSVTNPLPDVAEALDQYYSEILGGPPVSLSWKDLKVSVRSKSHGNPKVLMESMSGFAEPFNLVAILGVSKSGKSTLLNALSGRLSKDMTLAGEIFLNGRKQQSGYGTEGVSKALLAAISPLFPKTQYNAYLTSKDICNEMLTVQENMYISAKLKLPSAMAMKQRMNIIDQIMADLGLQHCASRHVGRYNKSKCLTRGERRRLVLAMELVMRPRLLYLDEATSGLDGSEALLYMTKLKVLAREGRTVIACCGEFNQNIFNLFDYVLVLGGHRTIYFGEACSAPEFFTRGGLYSSVEHNTVNYFLQVQAPEYEEINASMQLLEDPEKFDRFAVKDHENIQKTLIAVYEGSDISARMRAKLSNILSKKGVLLVHLHRHPNFADQIAAQTYRSFLSITRDIGHYWTRLVLSIFAVVMVGTIFFNLDHSIYSIQERATCLFLIFEMTVFITVGAIPFFFREMEIFESDRFNEHYHVLTFIIGMFLSSIPYLLITSLLSSCIGYFLIGLHRGSGHFSYLFLDLLTSLLVSESCMKNVAIIVGDRYNGMVIGSCIQTTFMLVAGYTSRPSDIPKPVWTYPMAWISFHRYGLTGLYQNEFIGVEFKQLTSQMSGLQVIESTYHMKHPNKWNSILILLFMLFIYHFLQYICIMKKRNLSTLWSLKFRKMHSMWKTMLFNK